MLLRRLKRKEKRENANYAKMREIREFRSMDRAALGILVLSGLLLTIESIAINIGCDSEEKTD